MEESEREGRRLLLCGICVVEEEGARMKEAECGNSTFVVDTLSSLGEEICTPAV